RSTTTASAPLARALSKRSGRSPGTNRYVTGVGMAAAYRIDAAAARRGPTVRSRALAAQRVRAALDDRAHRRAVAGSAEPCDHRGGDRRHVRAVVDGLARVDVAQMQLDQRSFEHFQRVEHRDRRERPRRGVDDDRRGAVDRLVDPSDELRLAVGLTELERCRAGLAPALRLDLGERRRAVDRGLAGAEAIEVRPVQHVDRTCRTRGSHAPRRAHPLYPMTRGSQRTVSGANEMIASTTIDAAMKGAASRTIAISVWRVMLATTKSRSPKGGVSRPIMMLTTTTTPKCTRSMPSAFAGGIRIGTMTSRIVVPSRRQPSASRMPLTSSRNPT